MKWANLFQSGAGGRAGASRQSRSSFGLWGAVIGLVTTLGVLVGGAQAQNSGIGPPYVLYTSSSAYCSPPEALLITALDFTFNRGNNTLDFDFAAAAVQQDLNVTIDVEINAYGLGIFAVTLDLCSAVPALCPLPTANFQVRGVFGVPQEFSDAIPFIAFTVPNLEAVATVQLTDPNGFQVGCVQATLSNGKSTYQTGAKWAAIGVFLLAVASALLHTILAPSLGAAQWRVVDVLNACQHVVFAALLNLQYPQVYVEFARNFAWSVGLIRIDPLQDSILSTRLATGGADSGTFGKLLTAQTGRRFNPFSNIALPAAAAAPAASSSGLSSTLSGLGLYKSYVTSANDTEAAIATNGVSLAVSAIPRHALSLTKPLWSHVEVSDLQRRQVYAPYTGPGGQILQSSNGSQLPLIASNGTSPVGLGYFAEVNNISPDSAFLTVLVSLAIFFGFFLAVCALIYLFALATRLATRRGAGRLASWSHGFTQPAEFYGSFCRTLFARYMFMTWQVLLVFGFYQWLKGDSWVPDLLAAVFLVIYLLGFFLLYFPVFRYAHRGSRDDLYYGEVPPSMANPIARRFGPIAHPFRPRYFWFALVLLLSAFVSACFISFGQGRNHGLRQSIGLAATDVLLLLVLCICRPGRDKTSDFVMIVLVLFRIASWGVNIAFTPEADVETIPRVIVGFVQIAVTGLPVVLLFFLTVWDLITPFFRKGQWNAVQEAPQEPMLEKNQYQFGNVGAGAGAPTATSTNSSEHDRLLDSSSRDEPSTVHPSYSPNKEVGDLGGTDGGKPFDSTQDTAATRVDNTAGWEGTAAPSTDTTYTSSVPLVAAFGAGAGAGAAAGGGGGAPEQDLARPPAVTAPTGLSNLSGNTTYYDAPEQGLQRPPAVTAATGISSVSGTTTFFDATERPIATPSAPRSPGL